MEAEVARIRRRAVAQDAADDHSLGSSRGGRDRRVRECLGSLAVRVDSTEARRVLAATDQCEPTPCSPQPSTSLFRPMLILSAVTA